MKHTASPIGVASSATSGHREDRIGSPLRRSSEVTISFFEDRLPPVIEAEMEGLYHNFFASPTKFRVYNQLEKVSTYVARADGRAIAIFVLRRRGKKIHVLNEQVHIPEEELNRFAQYIFGKHGAATMICFKTIDTQLKRLPYPYQRTYFTNDVVLPLPETVSEYQESLGKSTRENIKRYLKLLKRDFPSHTFQVYEKNEGGDELFRTIIDFNRSRMLGKNKVSGITGAEEDRLHALVRQCGMICTLEVNGRICAGTICYQFGDNFFMRVIAHDSAFNDYRVGLLCCYLTIGECIIRGGKNYHFLWGREEYKYRFLGQHRDFDSLTIYRSRLHQLLNFVPILKTAAKARINQGKLWLLDPANKDRKLTLLVHRLMRIRRPRNKKKKI